LLAGFYLLRVADTAVATYVGIALNVLVAGIALLSAGRTAYTPPAPSHGSLFELVGPRVIYVAIALSGLTALASEVIWTRLLSLTFGAL
jgi:hypothetical protein